MSRPTLRDCPFCHAKGDDDEKIQIMERHNLYEGGSYVASYSIFCSGCGVELHEEYLDDVVALWNGVVAVNAEDDEEDAA